MRLFLIFFLLISTVIMLSCSNDDDDDTTLGNWTKTTPFKGRPRSGAIVFTVGNTAFVGLGYDGDEYLSDFYSFDINKGFWEPRKTFPGTLRERAVAFSVNGKGYIGSGYNRDLTEVELADFWEYNPDTDEWTQVADFEGTPRYNAIAFTIGSKAYVGTGYDREKKYNSDFWEFDPLTNDWNEVQSYPGEKIDGGMAFVIDNKAYICGGRNNGVYNSDFWEFDPGSEAAWTNRAPDTDDSNYDDFKIAVRRHDALAFTMGDKAYVTGGIASSGATDKTVYQFDAATLLWDERTPFEGSARSLAIAFVLNDRAFVGTGQNGSSRYDDVWEFKPNEEYDDEN